MLVFKLNSNVTSNQGSALMRFFGRDVGTYQPTLVRKKFDHAALIQKRSEHQMKVAKKLTWRSTRRVTRKWPMLSTSFLMSEQFEGPYGNYKLEKGILHVNYVLKRFLVETT